MSLSQQNAFPVVDGRTRAGGRLAGRVALITGASRGIGAAVAAGMAREGADVALNHLPDPEMRRLAEQAAKEIDADGGNAMSVAADISDPDAVERMVAQVAHALGPPDVLVLNAAASDGRRPWDEITVDVWDRISAVNLRGAFLCARAVHPAMRARGDGRIITVSSVMAQLGAAGALHYVTTKAGVVGFTRALAREVGPDGITVNCVVPGAIRTEQELEEFPDQEGLRRRAVARQSVPRRGVPADLVSTFVYLASADSAFVTGQVINVDGGWV